MPPRSIVPAPTLSSTLAGTVVTSLTTLASAAPVGPLLASGAVPGPELALTRTNVRTTATTATMLPAASMTRRRTSARLAAARCAAIFWLRLVPRLSLLAFPMLARVTFRRERTNHSEAFRDIREKTLRSYSARELASGPRSGRQRWFIQSGRHRCRRGCHDKEANQASPYSGE